MKSTELCTNVQGLLEFWQNPAKNMGVYADQAEALVHCSTQGECPCVKMLFQQLPDHVIASLMEEMTPSERQLVEMAREQLEELDGWCNNPPPCHPRSWPD